jgi:flagellar basal-body rod modification protein FlgD
MTAITGNTNANDFAQYGLQATQAARKTQLGQADFLRLMTEQLKNQDPLKPLQGAEFLGQLAQFSTVQGIENMQSALGAVASVMESDQTLRAAALVGHDALVEASTLDIQAGAGVKGEVVATTAGPVQLDIVDASGQVVRRMSVQAKAAGAVPYAWDGKTTAGAAAPAGRYTVRATAGTGSDAQSLAVRVAARVDSVSIEPTGLTLNLAGLGSHPLSAVRRIG